METRKDQKARIAGGTTLPSDVSDAFGFVNRLRSAFDWVRTISATEPLTETTVDGLLVVKASVQSVVTSGEAAEKVLRNLVVARADAGDDLFVESDTTDTVFLGLPTHAKRFSVENRTRTAFDLDRFVDGLVADGRITRAEADARIAAATDHPTSRVVAFKPNPEADRKSTRLNSSHVSESRMPSSA